MGTTWNSDATPTPSPPEGSQCLEVGVTSPDTESYKYQTESSTPISYVHLHLMPYTLNVGSGSSFTVLELVDDSDTTACRVKIINDGGTNKWYAEFYDDNEGGNYHTTPYQTFTAQEWIKHIQLKYDITNSAYMCAQNGTTIESGSLVGNTITPTTMNLGINDHPGSSTDTVYMDWVAWDANDWVARVFAVSDSLSFTESLSQNMPLGDIDITEGVSISESVGRDMPLLFGVSDGISLGDAISKPEKLYPVTIQELLTLAESLSLLQGLVPVITETISIYDSTKLSDIHEVGVSDSVSISDAIQILRDLVPIISEAVSVSDSANTELKLEFSLSESLSISEVLTTMSDKVPVISEAVSLVEQLIFNGPAGVSNITPGVTDTISVDDLVSVVSNLGDVALTESVSLSEVLSFALDIASLSISESISITDTATVYTGNPWSNIIVQGLEVHERKYVQIYGRYKEIGG